jgi:probable rRNA maturation factor
MTRQEQDRHRVGDQTRTSPHPPVPCLQGRESSGQAAKPPPPSVDVVVESSLWDAHPQAEDVVVRAFAAAAPADLGKAEVAVLLADDARVREMNAQWRGKDAATNVLSFPAATATPGPGDTPRHLGDIVIAYETVAAEARAENKPFDHHLAHLVVHGFLHLLGYDHLTDDEADHMERQECDILAKLAIPDPYAARDADI